MVGFVVFSLMKFNKEKHITLKGTNSPRYQYVLEAAQLGTASQKALGVLADTKLTMGQRYALVGKNPTNSILGCVRSSVPGRGREGILPLYSALVTPHLGAGPVLGSAVHKRHGHTGESLAKAAEMMKGLEHLSFEESLRELELFSLEP